MRSVFVFVDADDCELSAFFDSKFAREKDGWVATSNDSAIAWISIHTSADSLEPDGVSLVELALGNHPSTWAMFDISGRVDGYDEALSLAALVLSEFRGVAVDDSWARPWTRDELEADCANGERQFFS